MKKKILAAVMAATMVFSLVACGSSDAGSNCGLAFLCHIGYDGCLIQALICINGTVEEDNSDTCILCILQYGIPTCGICCGQKQIVNAILNELLCCSDLLIVL